MTRIPILRRPRPGLRAKAFWGVVASSLATLVAVWLVVFAPLRDGYEELTLTTFAAVAGVAQSQVDDWLEARQAELEAWSAEDLFTIEPLHGDADHRLSSHLMTLVRNRPEALATLSCVDADGLVVASSDPGEVGRRHPGAWAGPGQLAARWEVGPSSAPDPVDGTLLTAHAYEAIDGSDHAIVARLRFDRALQQQLVPELSGGGLDAASSLVLVNATGQPLWSVGVEVPPESLAPALAGGEGLRQFRAGERELVGAVAPSRRVAGWRLLASEDEGAVYARLVATERAALLAGLLILVLNGLLARFFAARITEGILSFVPHFERLSSGDLVAEYEGHSGDEMEQLGGRVNQFVRRLREMVLQMAGDACDLMLAALTLDEASTKLSETAEMAADQAHEASASSDQLRAGSAEIASSITSMDSSLREISQRSDHVARKVHEAVSSVTGADAVMRALEENMSGIEGITKAITTIAHQTNMLAMNATIEAAKAGEAGHGFAVVANEVKQLAVQASGSANDIRRQLETLRDGTSEVHEAFDGIAGMIREISAAQVAIAYFARTQVEATEGVAQRADEVAAGAENLSTVAAEVARCAVGVADGARHARDGASSVRSVAEAIDEAVGGFRTRA